MGGPPVEPVRHFASRNASSSILAKSHATVILDGDSDDAETKEAQAHVGFHGRGWP